MPIASVPGGDVTVVVRAATIQDLEKLLPLFDEEFVLSRKRRISLAHRFPAVYSAANAKNMVLIEENDIILAALASNRFEWLAEGKPKRKIWRGAMIGAVCTRPERRGEGLASHLIEFVEDSLRAEQIDFAVLWTAQPEYYGRSGWIAADRGLLGEIMGDACSSDPVAGVTTTPADTGDFRQIEHIRDRWLAFLTPRRAENYRQLPIPAEAVSLLRWGNGTERAGYALVGRHGDSGFLYEMVGHPDSFTALWWKICSCHKRILVNDCANSASHLWLTQTASLAWQAKPLAMWKWLSEEGDVVNASHWYIPYFDRI